MAAVQKLKVHKPYPRRGCPLCGVHLHGNDLQAGHNTCKYCRGEFVTTLFSPPPPYRAVNPAGALSGAAPCAAHEQNAAVGNCDRCGSFMCALCATPLNGKAYCTACLERIMRDGAPGVLPGSERSYRATARTLGLLGLFAPIVGLFMAPFALYFAVKSFGQNRRLALGKRAAMESVGAVLLALLVLAIWGGVLGLYIVAITQWLRISRGW